jgi:hypothetical protein
MTRCPCCGSELTEEEAAGVRRRATGLTNSWETLRDLVEPPGTIDALLEGRARGGPTWWLPSLAYLAYQTADQQAARAVLDEFASRRDELGYAVVEEKTDEVVGFSIQPWPLVDERGRLRFPIQNDPLQLEVAESDLALLMRSHRQRWHELGLLPEELVERHVQIGDAYAVRIESAPNPSSVRTLHHEDERGPRFIGGLSERAVPGSVDVPVVDITWDAREAGKLAHYAAAAGVVDPTAPEAAMAGVVQETEARYMVGFRDGVDPRDISAEDLGPEGVQA